MTAPQEQSRSPEPQEVEYITEFIPNISFLPGVKSEGYVAMEVPTSLDTLLEHERFVYQKGRITVQVGDVFDHETLASLPDWIAHNGGRHIRAIDAQTE